MFSLADFARNNHFISLFHLIFIPFLISLLLSCGVDRRQTEINAIERMYNMNRWRNRPFDDHWKFQRGEIDGAERSDFNDSEWRILDLPHDWSIEDLPASADTFPEVEPAPVGPFSPASPGGLSTGFSIGGTAWYRKAFVVDTDDLNKLIYIRFDGIYMNADVWVNGHHLGNHPYGYTAFYFDMTPYLHPAGDTNVVAVEVSNLGRNSRWYSGSGIYRHVWLDVVDPVHIQTWGMQVTTSDIKAEQAVVKVSNTVVNQLDRPAEITINSSLTDPQGHETELYRTSGTIPPGGTAVLDQEIAVQSPALWSPASPELYLARSTVILEEISVDRLVTAFGIRSLEFNVESGFLLNGEKLYLRGGNMHHDNGPLGAATIDRAEYRRVELMKSNGYNAIRTSHNPPSTQFLDACDLYGILVIDEAFDMWQRPKNPQDYHLYFDDWWERDLASMVLRDRNHPSVIMWSIGNEINERADSSGLVLTQKMYDLVKQHDPTRPVTEAICRFWDHPGRSWEETAPAFALLDVGGYNYLWPKYAPDHEEYPERIMAGTESIAMEAWQYWKPVLDYDYVIGDFIWTAMDYLGEASIGHSILSNEKQGEWLLYWPWFNAWCGDLDLCGFKKPQSLYRDVVWDISDLEVLVHTPVPEGITEKISNWGWPDEHPHWNWEVTPGRLMQVSVYTDHQEVLLMLNDQEVGRQELQDSMHLKMKFEVPYEAGELMAVGISEGIPSDTLKLTTTGAPATLKLIPDRSTIRSDRNDLSYVTVLVCDRDGRRVPDADIDIEFEIDGAGELAGVANGNPKEMKSFQSPRIKSFNGRALVILRPLGEPGIVELKALAEGLTPSELEINIR